MTKNPTPTEKNSKKLRDNTKKRHQNFNYTTVGRNNNSHLTGVVEPVYERQV